MAPTLNIEKAGMRLLLERVFHSYCPLRTTKSRLVCDMPGLK